MRSCGSASLLTNFLQMAMTYLAHLTLLWPRRDCRKKSRRDEMFIAQACSLEFRARLRAKSQTYRSYGVGRLITYRGL
jgi:hypothetical protein